jgi:hypothetical protein
MAVAAPVAIGLMAASSLYEGYSQSRELKAGARADDETARRTELAGAFEEDAVRRRERAVSGEAISALAANGVEVGTGSALDLLMQNAVEREYEVLARRYSAGSEADSLRAQARGKRKAAKGALFGGVLRAGAQALSGYGGMQNAAAVAGASGRMRAAQMGGQKLPMPSNLVDPGPEQRRRDVEAGRWVMY